MEYFTLNKLVCYIKANAEKALILFGLCGSLKLLAPCLANSLTKGLLNNELKTPPQNSSFCQ